jgi:hypothetical protein
MSFVVSPSLTFRTDVQLVQMPAKQARGRVSSSANQIVAAFGLVELAEGVERHHATAFGSEPSSPVLAAERCGCWSCRCPAPSEAIP